METNTSSAIIPGNDKKEQIVNEEDQNQIVNPVEEEIEQDQPISNPAPESSPKEEEKTEAETDAPEKKSPADEESTRKNLPNL